MAKIRLVAYGIAKEILGGRNIDFEVDELSDISSLKKDMVTAFPDFEDLVTFSLAVDDEYREESYQLEEGCEVIIIPPVSGG